MKELEQQPPADPDAPTPPADQDAPTPPADPDAPTPPADPDAPTPPTDPDEPPVDDDEAIAENERQTVARVREAARSSRSTAQLLTKERKRHDDELEGILGEAAQEVLPCPVCSTGLQGYVTQQAMAELSAEEREIGLMLLGAAVERRLNKAEGVEECDRCGGWGKLEYPTKVEHVFEQNCPRCNGIGYTTKPVAVDTQPPAPPAPIAPPPVPSSTAPECPICGAVGMAGQPHYCVPKASAATV